MHPTENNSGRNRRDIIFVIAVSLITAILFLLPHSQGPGSRNSVRVRALVTRVDNSLIQRIGPIKQGEQSLELRILSGQWKGRSLETTNNLVGKIEIDKFFAPGDRILAVLDLSDDGKTVLYANAIDHYRTDKTLVLVALLLVLLVSLTGIVGFKTFVSFVFTAAIIFKVIVPAMLSGVDPILATLACTATLTAVILFLVGGVNKQGLTAFSGAMFGVLLTAILSYAFTRWFRLHGATRPFAEALIYSGYQHLNIERLFMSGIFLASSGAVMDLAMDVATAMREVREQQPFITRRGIVYAGLSVGKHMTGTMTTTLLLAYSAEYTAMLMTFVAQGIPFENVINLVFVSSEIVHTLVGCFGLVLVAPLTAIAGGFILGSGDHALDRRPNR